uniref:Serine/threonine-protein phosphatase n=1 Tax=Schlesneria paludicola TaxID=360056 RepID=A0A7C4LNL6_9PLAN
MKLRVGSLSITGRYRDNNEDNCYTDPQQRFFLVADGMGGQSAGERASSLAMEIVPRKLEALDFDRAPPEQTIRVIDEAVNHANFEIMALGELDARLKNMGTTIAFLVNVGGTLYIGGVGDSRAYLLRQGKLEQLTTDHSLVQALLDAGTLTPEEALNHRYRNVLYRYLGSKEGGTGTHPRQIRPQPGDRFVLCTDGVTSGVSDQQLAKLLGCGDDPQAIAEAIVKAAEDGGSKDNITCVVVLVDA